MQSVVSTLEQLGYFVWGIQRLYKKRWAVKAFRKPGSFRFIFYHPLSVALTW